MTFTATDADGAPFTTYVRSGGEFFGVPAAPLEMTRQGVHALEFLSVDAAGNQEAMRSRLLGIDWTAPKLSWAGDEHLTAGPGAELGLSVWIGDNLSPRCGIEVSVLHDGALAGTARLGTVATPAAPRRVTLSWTCPGARGIYDLLLLARDRAKNESVIGASLTVR